MAARLGVLGLWLVAVVIAFTVSLELTLLVTRSVLVPVNDLIGATQRVKQGDLSAPSCHRDAMLAAIDEMALQHATQA